MKINLTEVLVHSAQAHETADDHDIVATMHIDPNDKVIAGKEVKFYFILDDPKGKFDINHCNCVITISKDGQQIDQQQAKVSTGFFASLTTQPLYTKTFQEEGNYELELSGAPKDGVNFEEFTEHYDFRVAAPGTYSAPDFSLLTHNHGGHIFIFGGGLLASIILFIFGVREKRKNKNQAQNLE